MARVFNRKPAIFYGFKPGKRSVLHKDGEGRKVDERDSCRKNGQVVFSTLLLRGRQVTSAQLTQVRKEQGKECVERDGCMERVVR